MPKLTKKGLIKHLEKSDKEDIIREVVVLFDRFKNVKEFYAAELSGEANPLLEKYKRKIEKAYSLKNPKERSTNLNLNKLINEFKKISIYERELADLMLYRAECGIAAINRNANRSQTFYNSILNTFEEALTVIYKDNCVNEFEGRINKILKISQAGKYGIGEKMKEIARQFSD